MRLSRFPLARAAPAALTRVRPGSVLFESWHGRYSDNPRAISETLHRLRPDVEQTWVAHDPAALPPYAQSVRPDSAGYLRSLGAADVVVSSNHMPGYFPKKRRTTYVQTWHGTPLKRLAFDIRGAAYHADHRKVANTRRDIGRWDVLLSPNHFSTALFRTAFDYRGTVWETGYPRNDLLLSPERDELRRRTREALGIAPDQRAVLYAPTWRDSSSFSLGLDVGELCGALDDRYVLLLRAHHLVAAALRTADAPRMRNVSDVEDNRALFLAADVLVTDYSSVMFDFAVTGKPIVLFTYDLAQYRDDLRGFYFDLEAEAPGPLVHTPSALVDVLLGLEELPGRDDEAYARFVERFCHLDDGRASERVIEAVFGDAT